MREALVGMRGFGMLWCLMLRGKATTSLENESTTDLASLCLDFLTGRDDAAQASSGPILYTSAVFQHGFGRPRFDFLDLFGANMNLYTWERPSLVSVGLAFFSVYSASAAL